MKRVLLVILAIIQIAILCGCSGSNGKSSVDTKGTLPKAGPNQTPDDASSPVSEWGYNNLADMENAMVEITAYSIDKWGYGDVTVTGTTYLFENGYLLTRNFPLQPGKITFENTNVLNKYNIVDNNNIDLGNGMSSHTIIERKTSEYCKDFVVFVIESQQQERWFIPFNLIDWEKGARLNPDWELGEEKEYMLYLKPY